MGALREVRVFIRIVLECRIDGTIIDEEEQ